MNEPSTIPSAIVEPEYIEAQVASDGGHECQRAAALRTGGQVNRKYTLEQLGPEAIEQTFINI